ncbi:hypothetical protein PEPS_42680 (plasmid) [Persicobacter psychrovividus]|uniref:Ankyrin repeat protein n=2 Tax=Persicobacter psychrovividus TaxID=387638 RepID=A0ABM7VLV6_9BACT|nr:hypothetical protein PEPS_42680 [Persicobacter psychrovividus]
MYRYLSLSFLFIFLGHGFAVLAQTDSVFFHGQLKEIKGYLKSHEFTPEQLLICAEYQSNQRSSVYLFDHYSQYLKSKELEKLWTLSCRRSHNKLYKRIINHPEFNVKQFPNSIGTPIRTSLFCGNKKALHLLLKHGAQLDSIIPNHTIGPLPFALRISNFKMVDLLIAEGVELNTKIGKDQSVIDYMFEAESLYEQRMKRRSSSKPKKKYDTRIIDLIISQSHNHSPSDQVQIMNFAMRFNRESLLDKMLKECNIDEIKKVETFYLYQSAIINADKDYYQKLINKGFDVNAKDKMEVSPLMLAFGMAETPTIVNHLIDAGADIDTVDRMGQNMYFYAVENEKFNFIPLLTSSKLDIDHMDSRHFTPLCHAVQNHKLDMIKILHAHGADDHAVAYKRRSPMVVAYHNHDFEAMKLLVECSNQYHTIPLKITDLFVLLANADIDVVKLIGEELDIDLDQSIGFANESSLFSVAWRNPSAEALAYVLPKIKDIHQIDRDGLNAILLAMRNPVYEKIELLINAGINVNQKDLEGNTPIAVAIKQKNIDIIDLLIHGGADKNEYSSNEEYGDVPVIFGAFSDYYNNKSGFETFKALINRGFPAKTVKHLPFDYKAYINSISTISDDEKKSLIQMIDSI